MTISVQNYLTKKKDQFAAGVAGATGNTVTPPPNDQAWAANQNAPAPVNQDVATTMPKKEITYIEPPATPKPFESTAGNNVEAYVNRTSANLGKDPGAITEAGTLYADRVTNGLKTPDASSVNAQNTQDTAAARRAYLTRMQADEAIGQSGYGAGTAQADRIRANATSQIDSANQAGQNSVNAYLRQRTEDNMNRASDLEKQQYNRNRDVLGDAQSQDLMKYGRSERATDRGLDAAAVAYGKSRDAIADKRYDQTYADTRGDVADTKARTAMLDARAGTQQAFENAEVLKGADESAKRNLINSLPDGPAKNAVIKGLADGSLTASTALAQVMNADGTIKDEYKGSTPGALGLEAEKEYAMQTVDLEDPTLKTSNPQKYLERVNAEILANRKTQNKPVDDANQAAAIEAAKAKDRRGEPLTAEEEKLMISSGAYPEYTQMNLPTGSDAQSLIGTKVNIGGEAYTVVRQGRTGSDGNHTDHTIIKNLAGEYFFVDKKGMRRATAGEAKVWAGQGL